MDANSWINRLSLSSRRYQYALQSRSSDVFMGFEDIEADNDIRDEIQCPFCSGYFGLGGLCCHIGDEHPHDAKNGVCPVCGVRVGLGMVTHITLHHGNIFKISFLSIYGNNLKTGSISLLSLLRRQLRVANLQSNSGGSSYVVSSANATNAAPDPLLSSFILPMGDDLGINASKSLTEPMGFKKDTSKTSLQSDYFRGTKAMPFAFLSRKDTIRVISHWFEYTEKLIQPHYQAKTKRKGVEDVSLCKGCGPQGS
ncbi:hypothetical protein E3N88_28204 [Mikania micrantha]|uniref:Drought induced 19 protein type zinc-binding domain-containing protein n=1 Tax=Mikania micrantha TaxID=192012 RepID=A0A5N6MYV1_9ASTR|nr:hypothetical protein E3N88_28204 [Mikania micrantha]